MIAAYNNFVRMWKRGEPVYLFLDLFRRSDNTHVACMDENIPIRNRQGVGVCVGQTNYSNRCLGSIWLPTQQIDEMVCVINQKMQGSGEQVKKPRWWFERTRGSVEDAQHRGTQLTPGAKQSEIKQSSNAPASLYESKGACSHVISSPIPDVLFAERRSPGSLSSVG